MTVEITHAKLDNGTVRITAEDISDRAYRRMLRDREDCFRREYEFAFDTRVPSDRNYLKTFMSSQPAVQDVQPSTFGVALQALVGSAAEINRRYINWAAA